MKIQVNLSGTIWICIIMIAFFFMFILTNPFNSLVSISTDNQLIYFGLFSVILTFYLSPLILIVYFIIKYKRGN